MHGSEPRVSERRAPRGRLPAWRFPRHPAQCLPPRRSLCCFSETGPVARNGLSLAHNGFRFHGLHSGVNVPGLLLRSQRGCSQARSAFRSATGSVCPSPAASMPQPVACSLPRSTGSIRSLHSPLGLLPPSGSKRSTASEPTGPPSGCARSPLAPRSRLYR